MSFKADGGKVLDLIAYSKKKRKIEGGPIKGKHYYL
jgi:hypothetical protein